MSEQVNVHKLTKTGFLMVRKLLQGSLPGGPTAAIQLAEVFHSLPESGDNFYEVLTIEKLNKLITKYPEFRYYLGRFTK